MSDDDVSGDRGAPAGAGPSQVVGIQSRPTHLSDGVCRLHDVVGDGAQLCQIDFGSSPHASC